MTTDLGPPTRTRADRRFAVSELPLHPSLEHLRKQAKTRKRERGITLSRAQHELAREYGFDSWPKLVQHVEASGLQGIERALVLADPAAVSELLRAAPTAATTPIRELPPLLVLLRRSTSSARDVRECARRLLDAGADPNSDTVEWGGEGQMTALFDAVERRDLELVRLLLDRGADVTDCAFDDQGPTPLDCAIWGLQNNRSDDGDYMGTIAALVGAGAPTRLSQQPSSSPHAGRPVR
jgi:hypothetical protein